MNSPMNLSGSNGSLGSVNRPIKIGTRKSKLAITQAESIRSALKTVAPQHEYEVQVISTMADENQVQSFENFASKSIWTEELEELLSTRKLDVVVHCLKGLAAA